MPDFSEEKLKKDCPHCNLSSFATKHPLKETKNFIVVCDVHPLIEGHILIMPKQHISCIGEYRKNFLDEFLELYKQFLNFIKQTYGSVSSFEHGKIGQTVFHSHVHLLPFKGKPTEIVPEGTGKLSKLQTISELIAVFNKDNKYLFFSIEDNLWIVDLLLGAPRFFRDRFAKVLGNPNRGNWKQMHSNPEIMAQANAEIVKLEEKWEKYKAE